VIGIVSALRILGGGLHQYGFTVFFLPVTNELGLSRAATFLAFPWRAHKVRSPRPWSAIWSIATAPNR
jgi:hypothetical protein